MVPMYRQFVAQMSDVGCVAAYRAPGSCLADTVRRRLSPRLTGGYHYRVLDSWRLYGPQLRELLTSGEVPVAAAGCSVSFGADRLERSPEEIEHSFRFLPRDARERAVRLLQGEARRPIADMGTAHITVSLYGACCRSPPGPNGDRRNRRLAVGLPRSPSDLH